MIRSILFAASIVPALAAAPQPTWPKVDPAAMANWQAMRFGMFVHWGPVSLTAREIGWSRGGETPIDVYDNLYKQFNPTNFKADDWVSLAKAAGMKYIVLTTKHHDGFCLWDTKQTDYNIMNSPFKRDVVKELSAACKRQGLAFGTYYSVSDWHHPDFPLTSPRGKVKREKSDLDGYNRYLLRQISELITNYGPLVTVWNDNPRTFQGRGAETIKLVRKLQPDITINNRTGDGGDYDTPEQRVGKFQLERPWESCMTISAHNHWSWGGEQDGVKSFEACLRMLINCAAGDGNMLLNVGPKPTGEIAPEQANRLKEIGAWLARNGASIYGTRGGPWEPTQAVVSTRKDNTVFLHILGSETGVVELPAIPASIKSAALLGGGQALARQDKEKLVVTVPKAALDPVDTIVRLELDRPAMEIPAIAPPSDVKATGSTVDGKQDEKLGPQKAFDHDAETRRATEADAPQARLAVGVPLTARAAGQPNIIVIVADDLGYADLGCQVSKDVVTPNIDSLARNGVRFTDGYVTCPVCSPTRAGLLTGRYQERFGHEMNPPPPGPTVKADLGLPLTETTLADRLKAAGYATGMFGKWHQGLSEKYNPIHRGFDEYFGFLHGAHAYLDTLENPEDQFNPIVRGTQRVVERDYLTDVFTREGVSFIDRHKKEPFFLYLPYNAVHLPLQVLEKYKARFPDTKDDKRRTYLGMLAALDDGVGAVLAKVRAVGLEEKTLIFFFSDNGGPTAQTTSRNEPLRGFKNEIWEGGIRIPFLMQWPGHLPGGKVYREPVISLDVHATALAAAGAKPPTDKPLDGVNLLPYLTGKDKSPPHEYLFWRYGAQWAVRSGPWKLLHRNPDPPRLFNLSADIGETHDLAAEKPEVFKKLQSAWDAWDAQLMKPLWGNGQRGQSANPKGAAE